jgi:hypothetical protein
VGEPLCSDDWCLTVVHADRTPDAYRVAFRVSSRALRVTQREYGVHVYLTDVEGRRYEPQAGPSDAPFDVQVGPGEAVETGRRFVLPPEVKPVGVIIRKDGGFPIGWFIIGYETWFRKPTIVRLPA